jgi:hypothetical protein
MNESDGREAARKLAKDEQGVKIPFALKAVLWDKPMLMLSFSILMLGMCVPVVRLLFRITSRVRLGKLEPVWGRELVILSLLIPAFFAVIFAVSSYMLLRRRGKTGQFLLSRAELKERVARDLQPKPKWKRIAGSAIYFLLACDITFSAMSSQHHRGLYWGVAVFIWLCAMLIAAAEFGLFRRKQSVPAHPAEQKAPPAIQGS